jgi:glycosyltransferase involved in cell wall biosynthesis
MRILVITNLYPPYYIGGYELGCRDVVDALVLRGHQIRVLTSTYGVAGMRRDGDIYRCLETELAWKGGRHPARRWLDLARKELRNRAIFKRIVAHWRPDVIYIWNMRAISLSLILLAQQLRQPICYYISDDWLAKAETIDRWLARSPNPIRRTLKKALEAPLTIAGLGLAQQALDLRRVQFTSEHLKQATLRAGKPVQHGEVIHWGVDIGRFAFGARSPRPPRRLLYVGQLAPAKGVHTAVEAVRLLCGQYGIRDLQLTIVGGTSIPAYVEQLKSSIADANLEGIIHLAGSLRREQLPRVYQEHDLLIFPSIWDEPFSITLLEAMSSGLAIVGTDTGGSAEILRDGENALVFPKGDAQACASRIRELLGDPELFERVRSHGRATIVRQFRIEQTVDRIERSLIETQRGVYSL